MTPSTPHALPTIFCASVYPSGFVRDAAAGMRKALDPSSPSDLRAFVVSPAPPAASVLLTFFFPSKTCLQVQTERLARLCRQPCSSSCVGSCACVPVKQAVKQVKCVPRPMMRGMRPPAWTSSKMTGVLSANLHSSCSSSCVSSCTFAPVKQVNSEDAVCQACFESAKDLRVPKTWVRELAPRRLCGSLRRPRRGRCRLRRPSSSC